MITLRELKASAAVITRVSPADQEGLEPQKARRYHFDAPKWSSAVTFNVYYRSTRHLQQGPLIKDEKTMLSAQARQASETQPSEEPAIIFLPISLCPTSIRRTKAAIHDRSEGYELARSYAATITLLDHCVSRSLSQIKAQSTTQRNS